VVQVGHSGIKMIVFCWVKVAFLENGPKENNEGGFWLLPGNGSELSHYCNDLQADY